MIRIITKSPPFAHSPPLFRRSNILTLVNVHRHEICKFIHNDLHSNNRFEFRARNSVHNHVTRSNTHLSLPQPRSNTLRNSIFYDGLQVYNNIPNDLKSISSSNSFKNTLKFHLLNLNN